MTQSASNGLGSRVRTALYYARKKSRARRVAQAEGEDPGVKAQRDAVSLAAVRKQNGVT